MASFFYFGFILLHFQTFSKCPCFFFYIKIDFLPADLFSEFKNYIDHITTINYDIPIKVEQHPRSNYINQVCIVTFYRVLEGGKNNTKFCDSSQLILSKIITILKYINKKNKGQIKITIQKFFVLNLGLRWGYNVCGVL